MYICVYVTFLSNVHHTYPFIFEECCQRHTSHSHYLNTQNTLVADVPATRIPKLSNRLPAAIFLLGKFGWLNQFVHLPQSRLRHIIITSAIVPCAFTSTMVLLHLHSRHIWNRHNSWVRNTINFGSFFTLCTSWGTLKDTNTDILLYIKVSIILPFPVKIDLFGEGGGWTLDKHSTLHLRGYSCISISFCTCSVSLGFCLKNIIRRLFFFIFRYISFFVVTFNIKLFFHNCLTTSFTY